VREVLDDQRKIGDLEKRSVKTLKIEALWALFITRPTDCVELLRVFAQTAYCGTRTPKASIELMRL
jgi:hypothetical protein